MSTEEGRSVKYLETLFCCVPPRADSARKKDKALLVVHK